MAAMVCLQGETHITWHTHAKCLGKVGADQGVQGMLRTNTHADTGAKYTPEAVAHAREALLTPRLQLNSTSV